MDYSEKMKICSRGIESFYKRHRRMPSYSEMLKIFRVKSKNAVFKRVNYLVKMEALERDSTGKIVPKRLLQSLRVLGVVAAGFPSPAAGPTG